MRTRFTFLAVALLLGACAEPIVSQPSSTLQVTATAVSATSVPPDPTTTTIASTTTHVTAEMHLLERLLSEWPNAGSPVLPPGESLDEPAGFPSVEELAVASNYENNGVSHARALITSYMGPIGSPADLVADGMDARSALGVTITITNLDDVMIFDSVDFGRLVFRPPDELWGLAPDGTWHEVTNFDMGHLYTPLLYQGEAQISASGVLDGVGKDRPGYDLTEVVGYELLGGVETVRVRATGEQSNEIWVTAEGKVMRLIRHWSYPSTPETMSYVWNVESLDPQPNGPLPPGF